MERSTVFKSNFLGVAWLGGGAWNIKEITLFLDEGKGGFYIFCLKDYVLLPNRRVFSWIARQLSNEGYSNGLTQQCACEQ